MSLLPLLFHDIAPRPQHSTSKDWLSLFCPEEVRNQLSHLEEDSCITVVKDRFQVNLDVQQFKPEEITVKLEDDTTIIVEGKHEEKQDQHGYISRHFRRYVLPEDCDAQKVHSKLSSDGVLTISAPKKPEGNQLHTKPIPISLTGPVRGVEQKKQPQEKVAKKD